MAIEHERRICQVLFFILLEMKEKGRDRERTVIGVERREERDDDRRLEERPLHHRRRCLN